METGLGAGLAFREAGPSDVPRIVDELIAYYVRPGYRRTGELTSFPYGDERFGVPQRLDLEFELLVKDLG
jgi:hypothetical protein